MTISNFYHHPAILEGFGPGRTKRVISQLREVWPEFLGEKSEVINKGGRAPSFYKEVNEFYAAWLLFILSNCRSHNREDVVRAVKRGQELRRKGEYFITWFGKLLANPERIEEEIMSIYIFYDRDNMVSVFTEPSSPQKGDNFLFHGNSPAYKIRRAAILEKDFLLEMANLIRREAINQETASISKSGITDPDGTYHEQTIAEYGSEYEAMDLETKLKEYEKEMRDEGRTEADIQWALREARGPK